MLSAAIVGTALQGALAALPSTLPVTISGSTPATTFTANDVGTLGNKYTVNVVSIPAGLTYTGGGQLTSGATDPTLTTLLDTLATQRFHAISWPWESAYTVVQTFLEARNVINNAFLHGVAFIGFDDTEANIKTKVNGTNPLNSPNLLFIGNEKSAGGVSAIITPPDWRAVELISIEALRLTSGSLLGQYVATTSQLDVVGGPGSASLPLFNTPLKYTSLTDPASLFSDSSQQNLENYGFTIIGVNESKTSMITGQVMTTYKVNTRGENDTSFKYLEYIRTGYEALEIFYRTFKADYAQSRLTQGDLVAGRSMANDNSIKGNCLRIYKILSSADYTLLQSGRDAQKYFLNNLSVTTNLATGSVTISGQLPIVTQLRSITITFQLSFSIGG